MKERIEENKVEEKIEEILDRKEQTKTTKKAARGHEKKLRKTEETDSALSLDDSESQSSED